MFSFKLVFASWIILSVFVGHSLSSFCRDLALKCPFLTSRHARPVVIEGATVNVTAMFWVFQLLDIHDLEERLRFQAMFDFSWNVPCASWHNESLAKECWFANDEIWRPRIDVWNGIGSSQEMFESYGSQIMIDPTGTAWFSAKGIYDISCTLKFYKFPYDVQTCRVIASGFQGMGASKALFFTNRSSVKIGVAAFNNDADIWELLQSFTEIKNDLNAVNYGFVFRRKASYYYGIIFIPTFFLSAMMLASLAMPAHLADRAAFAVTVYLSFSFLQGTFYASIPKTSEVMYMVVYMMCHNGCSVFIVLWSLVSCRWALTNKFYSQPPTRFLPKTRMILSDILDLAVFIISFLFLIGANILYFAKANEAD